LRAFELASFLVLFVLVAVGFAVLSRNSVDDDGQVLRVAQQSGPFAIAFYGPAGAIPVGPATFAVLVQDRSSHQVLLDSDVEFSLKKTNDTNSSSPSVRALPGDENQLLFRAELDVEAEGPWLVEVAAHRGTASASVTLPIEAVKPDAGIVIPWSAVVMLAFAALLCGVYLWRHRASSPTSVVAPIA
jgi:hypothetical protein